LPIVFPVHPRTRDRLEALGLAAGLAQVPGLVVTDPLGYVDMLALMQRARVVLTDSGGVQEETTYLGVPCLTLRDNTERPATVVHGTNRVVGTRPERVLAAFEQALEAEPPPTRRPPLWDGHAADRVADVLADVVGSSGAAASGA
jgi:UDP-N-acetylglucosamine 2-epimerase (non-hydrolysing)